MESRREGLIGKRQKEVMAWLKARPYSTDKEISILSGIPINVVTPRRGELVKYGLVKECNKRKCTITGRKALTWRIK